MNQIEFIELLKTKNIEISQQQLELFEKYFQILVDYNEKVNLTSITEKEEVYLKHFYDSLTILTEYQLKENSTLCDVGAGAGFPSVPLKIIRPDLDVTIVDALGKRIDFLNGLFNQLGLQGIKAVHSRAEEFTLNHRESFDYVTARAVARLNLLAELCIPLVKMGGEFIALKGNSGIEELKEATNGTKTLGCKEKQTISFSLPFEGGEREIIVLEKNKKTPLKYPRNFGQIKKKPL
jgi:16S rRNA (guanine527-N7)-methyltransferase